MPTFPFRPPEEPSVFDSTAKRALHALGSFFGASDPTSMMPGPSMMATETKPLLESATQGLKKAGSWILDDAGREIAPMAGNAPYAKYFSHQPVPGGGDAIPMFSVKGGLYDKSTQSLHELERLGIPTEGTIPTFDPEIARKTRDAAMARFNGTTPLPTLKR